MVSGEMAAGRPEGWPAAHPSVGAASAVLMLYVPDADEAFRRAVEAGARWSCPADGRVPAAWRRA